MDAKRFFPLLLLYFAFIAPWLLTPIKNTKWPLRLKQTVALVSMGLFTGLMIWVLVGEIEGDRYLIAGAKVVLLAYFLFGLFVAYNAWPREEKVDIVTDIQEKLQKAIEDMEKHLGLSRLEHLEKLNPREGTYSHTLIRYADSSWLEWLNPTDKKGIPDFSYFAVYSNNRQIVKILNQLVGRYCNVEQQDKPLWR